MSDEIPPSPDAPWASLAQRLLHPVQVDVMKALGQGNRPLSAREIAEVVKNTSAARLSQHDLRGLRRLGAIEHVPGKKPHNRIDDLPADDC